MTDVVPASSESFEPDTLAMAEVIASTAETERDPLVMREATVTAVSPGVGVASTCSVSVGGAAAISGVRHICAMPDVGDTVWLMQWGAARMIVGVIGGPEKVGTISWIGGTGGAPPGWWPCDGRSTSGYPKLAARYGANIPDLRDRFVVGSGPTHVIGSTGGVATTTDLPAHTHPIPAHGHDTVAHTHGQQVTAAISGGSGVRTDYASDFSGASAFPQGVSTDAGGAATTQNNPGFTSSSTGVSGGVDNRPPYYALLAIIKFG